MDKAHAEYVQRLILGFLAPEKNYTHCLRDLPVSGHTPSLKQPETSGEARRNVGSLGTAGRTRGGRARQSPPPGGGETVPGDPLDAVPWLPSPSSLEPDRLRSVTSLSVHSPTHPGARSAARVRATKKASGEPALAFQEPRGPWVQTAKQEACV